MEKKLKTLEEHNVEIKNRHNKIAENGGVPNGIACPFCNRELIDTGEMIIMCGKITMRNKCDNCGSSGTRLY